MQNNGLRSLREAASVGCACCCGCSCALNVASLLRPWATRHAASTLALCKQGQQDQPGRISLYTGVSFKLKHYYSCATCALRETVQHFNGLQHCQLCHLLLLPSAMTTTTHAAAVCTVSAVSPTATTAATAAQHYYCYCCNRCYCCYLLQPSAHSTATLPLTSELAMTSP
eukprot:19181-Heterococcus_DN1.PRE.2